MPMPVMTRKNASLSLSVDEPNDEPTCKPTHSETVKYAKSLGMNIDDDGNGPDKEKLWIAREGLKAPVPKKWKPELPQDQKQATSSDSIVLEEAIDLNYEPTTEEVMEYAKWLGMDIGENGEHGPDKDLIWIAREGLKAPLPENWKPCKTLDTKEIYYFNFQNGESSWDHPCDNFYRQLYEEEKEKERRKENNSNRIRGRRENTTENQRPGRLPSSKEIYPSKEKVLVEYAETFSLHMDIARQALGLLSPPRCLNEHKETGDWKLFIIPKVLGGTADRCFYANTKTGEIKFEHPDDEKYRATFRSSSEKSPLTKQRLPLTLSDQNNESQEMIRDEGDSLSSSLKLVLDDTNAHLDDDYHSVPSSVGPSESDEPAANSEDGGFVIVSCESIMAGE